MAGAWALAQRLKAALVEDPSPTPTIQEDPEPSAPSASLSGTVQMETKLS